MKTLSFVIVGGVLGGLPLMAGALATVESRTGEPMVRSSAGATTDDRAARLTMKQVEALQKEVSELRGLVETQDHEIQKLKKSQQDLYLDLDKRLTVIQGGGSKKSKKENSTVVPLPKEAPVTPTEPLKVPAEIVMPAPDNKGALLKPEASTLGLKSENGAAATDPYEFAYQLVRAKRYPEAIVAFQDYLRRFPQGDQAANANFWMGEVYMAEWQADKTRISLLDNATQSFLNITSHFPNHQKATDALLKLGLIELEKENIKAARRYFIELKTRYPTSSAARIAENRLQQLE